MWSKDNSFNPPEWLIGEWSEYGEPFAAYIITDEKIEYRDKEMKFDFRRYSISSDQRFFIVRKASKLDYEEISERFIESFHRLFV